MKKYDISNYDKHLCLKANGMMIAIALYLLKPFIIAASSLISLGKLSALDVLYPSKLYISLEAAAAIPVLLLLYAWSRRSPDATEIIKRLCKNGKTLVITTAFLQLCVSSSPLWIPTINAMTSIGWIQLSLYVLIILITAFSNYMRDCFYDFPKPTEKGDN